LPIGPPRPLTDGQELSLGSKKVRWLDAPRLPHNWECGYQFETTKRSHWQDHARSWDLPVYGFSAC